MAVWKRDKTSGIWRRDVEVVELISHFDQPGKKDEWEKLSHKEVDAIQREVQRCREDFVYAARNYFILSTKAGEDIPFSLWEPQELILEKWMWARSKFPDKAQRLMILKARQLGCSTLIEGLIAWSTIFFSNRNAMVVSNTDGHAAYLFEMMQNFYDRLPWWLQPMIASRRIEEGLFFANPDYTQRRDNPGNMSRVVVQSAKQTSGVGRGIRLNSVHLSEYTDWDWGKFKDIIAGDMIHALSDNINSFAFLESTGKGAGSPGEEMWNAQVHLGEEAKWIPVFLPWFFERSRFLPPEHGWRTQQPESDMREKVAADWVKCDNEKCGSYSESNFRGESRALTTCTECRTGLMNPVILKDGQLRFMQRERVNAEEEGLDAVKKLKEELACTAEEAWQLSGVQVFPPECIDFVNKCVHDNPRIWGSIDEKGRIHYVKDFQTGQCGLEDCPINHRWDVEHPLRIWELPDQKARYCLGVDVAEGLAGKADYSVIWVNKYYQNGRGPDEQVAIWRSNTVDPIALAGVVNHMGRLYNDGLACIEVNKYDSCDMALRLHHMYPNSFVWKHYDSKNPISNKMGWVTNQRTKPMLWQQAVRSLKARMWIIRESIFAQEMKRFQKDDYDDTRASAEKNFHDDCLIAGMIAHFCAHDMDYGDGGEYIPPSAGTSVVSVAEWLNSCERCKKTWQTEAPARKCQFCSAMAISCHRNSVDIHKQPIDIEKELKNSKDFMDDTEEERALRNVKRIGKSIPKEAESYIDESLAEEYEDVEGAGRTGYLATF